MINRVEGRAQVKQPKERQLRRIGSIQDIGEDLQKSGLLCVVALSIAEWRSGNSLFRWRYPVSSEATILSMTLDRKVKFDIGR